MTYRIPYLIWWGLFLLWGSTDSFGQINIDYPSERAVFQRDKLGNATIYIAGSYTASLDRVEARLNAINGGFSTDWITIQSNPQGGLYSGSLNGSGGWYELQVRGRLGDQVIGQTQLSRVGIGEVFMIAGQSNAQGFQGYGGPGASDDRVNCINANNDNVPFTDLSYPQFSHLDADANISPRGYSAWAWGRLGDLLANKLGVPILFYNSGWTGTAIRNWRESINGSTNDIYVGSPITPSGMPYANLRSVLQYYVPVTGIRAILWQQGEADNYANTGSDAYFNDLKTIIENSRNESGKNISWIVSQTSYDNDRGTSPAIVTAQNRVINSVSNVFSGPNTDIIQIPRPAQDVVHFRGEGLVQLAEAWNGQLNSDFFSRSEPFQAVSPLNVSLTCAGNNQVNLNINNIGYSSFNWTSGQNSNSIQVGNGNYRAKARDGKGNVIFSPEIKLSNQIQPNQPFISLEGSNPVCLGNSATLVSSTSENIQWNTGQTSARLNIVNAGEYFVTTKNLYGCSSSSSKISITVSTSPLPEKPSIAVSGAVTFCAGGEVQLQSNSKLTNLWSNGANTGAITVKSSGEYRVKAVDNVGCFSPDSDPVNVRVNPLPGKPVIFLSGSTTFCQGNNVTLTSSFDNGNIWSNSSTTKAITVAAAGIFSLKQHDANGCESSSDQITVSVNPLPATPTVTALRPTTFCQRDYTTLKGSDSFAYVWSNGATDKEIEVRNTGDYTLSARDGNGCTSIASPSIRVVANPLPAQPKIIADGPTTFCADKTVNLSTDDAAGFKWSNGGTTKSINVNSQGAYTVQTISEFQCYSDPSASVGVAVLALPSAPLVEALGPVIFCDGGTVELKATNGSSFFWNTGAETDLLVVDTSGSYKARIKDNSGCISPFSKEIVVDVKPSPTTPVIEKTGVYTLVAKNNINDGDHIWKLNGAVLAETGASLKANKSGTYVVNNTVVYGASLTCFSDFSTPFVVNVDNNEDVIIYPNPASEGKMSIETFQDLTNSTVQVIDSRGIIHKSFAIPLFDRQKIFSIDGLPNGVYIIRIISSSVTVSKKLIILK